MQLWIFPRARVLRLVSLVAPQAGFAPRIFYRHSHSYYYATLLTSAVRYSRMAAE